MRLDASGLPAVVLAGTGLLVGCSIINPNALSTSWTFQDGLDAKAVGMATVAAGGSGSQSTQLHAQGLLFELGLRLIGDVVPAAGSAAWVRWLDRR